MQACKAGGARMQQALTGLYRDYRRALVNDGFAALKDADMAHDLLQDTVLSAWLQCKSFRGDSELFPWLKTIYRRKLVDLLRRRAPETPLPPDAGAGEGNAELDDALRAWRGQVDATPDEALGSRQSEACFRACAARFAQDHPLCAAVVRWSAEDELGADEIAKLLGRSPGATREYMSQCRKKARLYFADWYALTLRGDRGGRAARRDGAQEAADAR